MQEIVPLFNCGHFIHETPISVAFVHLIGNVYMLREDFVSQLFVGGGPGKGLKRGPLRPRLLLLFVFHLPFRTERITVIINALLALPHEL